MYYVAGGSSQVLGTRPTSMMISLQTHVHARPHTRTRAPTYHCDSSRSNRRKHGQGHLAYLWQDHTSWMASRVPIPAPRGSPAGPNLPMKKHQHTTHWARPRAAHKRSAHTHAHTQSTCAHRPVVLWCSRCSGEPPSKGGAVNCGP